MARTGLAVLLLVLAGGAARAECLPLDERGLGSASLVVAGEIESVRATKHGGREVRVRGPAYLRGVGPDVLSFREVGGAGRCPAEPLEPGRRYLFLLREHPKRGLVPLSAASPDWGYRSSIVPLAGEALEASLWPGGPASLPAVRDAASRIESAVLYEPSEPTDRDRVAALLPAPLGCPTKGWAKVRAGRIVSGTRARKGCAALAKARPWVRVDLGRLAPGRYVHFHGGEWLGYLVVGHKP